MKRRLIGFGGNVSWIERTFEDFEATKEDPVGARYVPLDPLQPPFYLCSFKHTNIYRTSRW